MSEVTAVAFLKRLHQVAKAVAWQAGESEMDTAGAMVSILIAHPEWLVRFMAEGAGLFIDVGFDMSNGALNFRSRDGQIRTPEELFSLTNRRPQ